MKKRMIFILWMIWQAPVLFLYGEGYKGADIIPTPKNIELKNGIYQLKPFTTLSVLTSDTSLLHAADYLSRILQKGTGYTCHIVEGVEDADIQLEIIHSMEGVPGTYCLDVSESRIKIQANHYDGIIAGISSLRQLLPVEIEKNFEENPTIRWEIPTLTIRDAPRFQYRGFMLDVARYFFDKEYIFKLLDRMALYKLNKFHWHLTDNEGWRIEIERYPELTESGAWRIPDNLGSFAHMKIERDDRSDFFLPPEFIKIKDGKPMYGGYFTRQDIRDVVAYAAKLGIDVIPEIDMPGHFRSATTLFPQLVCENSPVKNPKVICVGKDETIDFCKNIYKELFDLFPYEYIHLGADEVDKTNWSDCPHCQKRIKDCKLQDEKELQSWFVHTMEDFFTEHGKKLIGWEEIAEGGLSKTSTVMWWLGNDSTVLSVTAHGNCVISTPNTWAYFDHQPFYREPFNGDIATVYTGDPVPATLPAEYHHFIWGGQGNVWGEFISSESRMEYMSLPKMLCLSEICWIEPEDKDWNVFSKKLEKQILRLDAMGLNYQVPYMESSIFKTNRHSDWMNIPSTETPTDTVVLVDGFQIVTIEKPYPNVTIRYTTDGSVPGFLSEVFVSPMTVAAPSEYVFAAFRPNGTRSEYRKVVFINED